MRDSLARTATTVAVVAGAAVALELWRAGSPLGPLRGSLLYPSAVAAALALAARSALSRAPRAPVIAAALSAALFLANDRAIVSGDTHPTGLVPYAALRHGTLSLDPVPVPDPLPYWVVRSGGRIWSRYPVTGALLALPVYVPAALGPGIPGGTHGPEKLAAALMCAASAGFLLAALRRAGAPRWLALVATALYSGASPVLAVASQALWQHAPSVLALSAALWATVRARAGDPRFAAWAGWFAGIAVTARFTDVFAAAALAFTLLPLGARRLGAFALAAAAPVAALAAYHAVAFGAPWATGYAGEAAAFATPLAEGLRGVLLSPTRGLLTFVPWTALALAGLALGARRDRLQAALLAATIATILVYAQWHAWWGGWCYGPRMLSDLTPLLAFGLLPLARFPARSVAVALALTGVPAALLCGFGAFSSRSPAARAVYEADGRDLAAEWSRYPPAAMGRALAGQRR